jgi:AraC-like DNA-binding protein
LTVRRLRPAESLASYIANPIGSYVAGRSAAAFWANEALSGLLFWGHPDEADAELIAVALRTRAALFARPYALLVDLRQLEFIDLRAFDKLRSGLASHFGSLGGTITRHALITPKGSVGAILAQFFKFMSQGSSMKSFADAGDALVWIGVGGTTLLEDLERIPHISPTASSMLTGLRTDLEQSPASSAYEVARRFGMSQRTFQRRLRELGTSFQQEVNAVHVRIAKRLMQETNNSLKWIAVESGYASLQHFSSSFRARVGLSPSEWRANRSGTKHA